MRHSVKRHRLDRSPSHRLALMNNLSTALFRYERIRTTLAKAKALRPYAEPLLTLAKEPTLHNRREILKRIKDKEVVKKLFTEIGPRIAERPGGYLRIIHAGTRPGDSAPMAYIEFVDKRVMEAPEDAAAQPEQKKSLLSRVFGG